MRLHRLIALCSELSRRAAEEAIAAGRVTVNGTVVTEQGVQVQTFSDHVKLDAKLLQLPKEHIYLAFHKPSRMLVTKSDPQGRETIWSLLSTWKSRLNAAGRLDYDAEGLLILSDDGNFINRLTHPRHEVWKVYQVKVKGVPTEAVQGKLSSGVVLDDGTTLPAKVRLTRSSETHAWLQIGIREGRNRQIKRMCEAIGHPVIKLKRAAIGPIRLGQLKPGKWRFLSAVELAMLDDELQGKRSSEPPPTPPSHQRHEPSGKKSFSQRRRYVRPR